MKNAMGTIEYEQIQRKNMKQYDRLVARCKAESLAGQDVTKLISKIEALRSEMSSLYDAYKSGKAESRIQAAGTKMAIAVPRWN